MSSSTHLDSSEKSDGRDTRFSQAALDDTDPLIVPAQGQHTHTFIILHGRGDTAKGFGPRFLLSEHKSGKPLPKLVPGMKFVFPTAKRRRMIRYNRGTMNQWFDLASLKGDVERGDVQLEGLQESSMFIQYLILEEMKLIPCENIILGGLSQGCATALYTLLTFEPPPPKDGESPNRLGAVVGMSGWLPFRKVIEGLVKASGLDVEDRVLEHEQLLVSTHGVKIQALNALRNGMGLPSLETTAPAALDTPVFMGHGTADETVEVSHGENATKTLRMLGIDVWWTPYHDFYHWYKEPDEIDDIFDFLEDRTSLIIS